MTFGQSIEYNRRNMFLEKSYTKYVGEILFLKKIKVAHNSG